MTGDINTRLLVLPAFRSELVGFIEHLRIALCMPGQVDNGVTTRNTVTLHFTVLREGAENEIKGHICDT